MLNKRTQEEEKEKKPNETTCLLDHYALSNILDFTDPPEIDHPFRQLCKATRQAWLAHPFSLPLRIKQELAYNLPVHALTLEQRNAFVQNLCQANTELAEEVASEREYIEKQKKQKRKLELRKRWIPDMMDYLTQSSILGSQDEGKITEVLELLNRASKIKCSMHEPDDEILGSYRHWLVRVVIDGVVMCYSSVPDCYRVLAWTLTDELPHDWEECRKKWNTKELSAAELSKVFRHLVVVEKATDTWPYRWIRI